ncbi:MAG: response regulator transcription factor [candidate division Zixibacteria bacterium]|nr:response regulator transcription factor [candidate division Zixibacteria bacterium]
MNRIRVILADDHSLFRAGLRSILEAQPGFEIVGEAVDGHSTLACLAATPVDILLLDISMPGLNGIETLRRIGAQENSVKVITLSMHSDRYFIAEAFKAGAKGYLLKDSAIQELVKGIRTVMEGNVYLSSTIAGILVDDYVALANATRRSANDLTSREREVLQMIAEGRSTKEVASQLCLSTKTVETHRKRLMDKLEIHSVAELTRYAIRARIIPGEC